MITHNNFGPEHDARTGHHEHSPDESPVLGFLRVIETGKLRLVRGQAEMVTEILPGASDILKVGEQVLCQSAALPRKSDVAYVINAHRHQRYGRDPMQQATHVFAER